MSQGDFFDDEDSEKLAQAEVAAKRRRRTRTIALMALGGVSALSVYACMKAEEEQRLAQQANGGAAGANGQQAQTQHRSSYFPWIWMMNRGGMFGGGGAAPMPGATSGFNSGGGTATAGRSTVTPGGSASTSTSRGGFGAFGRALSGLS
ncbi:hypothetical protein GC170_20000 [bacterium]|nr:hypothetical protein [bacterium]